MPHVSGQQQQKENKKVCDISNILPWKRCSRAVVLFTQPLPRPHAQTCAQSVADTGRGGGGEEGGGCRGGGAEMSRDIEVCFNRNATFLAGGRGEEGKRGGGAAAPCRVTAVPRMTFCVCRWEMEIGFAHICAGKKRSRAFATGSV